MTKYRHRLPQLGDQLFLTDAGIETTLIFHDKLDLPCFATFTLLKDANGTEALRRYYRRHAAIARDNATGFVLESATCGRAPTGALNSDTGRRSSTWRTARRSRFCTNCARNSRRGTPRW